MAKKFVTKVNFMDDSSRSFAIEENTTTEQLRTMVSDKLELKEDSCFALFERKDGWGLLFFSFSKGLIQSERCLEPDEKPAELMTLWNVDSKKSTKETTAPDSAFVFKKKIFLRDDERELQDLVAKHSVYIQVIIIIFNNRLFDRP